VCLSTQLWPQFEADLSNMYLRVRVLLI